MLKTQKSISLEGYSVIKENGIETQVLYLNANISTDGHSNGTINTSILNQDLYYKHRKEVRNDMNSFNDKVFETEDSLIAEQKAEQSQNTPTTETPNTSGTINTNKITTITQ